MNRATGLSRLRRWRHQRQERSDRLLAGRMSISEILEVLLGDPRADPVAALRTALVLVGEIRLALARAEFVPQEHLVRAHAEIDLLAEILTQVNLQATELHVRVTGSVGHDGDTDTPLEPHIRPVPGDENPARDQDRP